MIAGTELMITGQFIESLGKQFITRFCVAVEYQQRCLFNVLTQKPQSFFPAYKISKCIIIRHVFFKRSA